ncbi:MAG TPA: hypothetical protein VFP86_20970 [bacterium]|nr:hypothetical protein [bacterium]
MRIALAVLAVFAVIVAAPLVALGQSPTPPAQQGSAASIEGVVASVDTTCGGKASADCMAIVEVAQAPSSSQGGSTPPSSGSTYGYGNAPSGPSTGSSTMKIVIPKSVKITSESSSSSSPTSTSGASSSDASSMKLSKGDKVKITYEKKQGVNVATSVTVTKSGS